MKKLALLGSVVALSSAVALASSGAEPTASAASSAASASAAPATSASASAPPPPPIAQAIPTAPSEAPTTEWDSAKPVWSKLFEGEPRFRCDASLIREWLKVRCESPNETKADRTDPATFGVVWGIAGDLSGASAKVPPLAKTTPEFKPAGTAEWELEFFKKTAAMGGRAEVVLPLRPGSATLVELGRMGWAREYAGDFEMVLRGPLLEVSWAKGEAQPRVVLEGVVVIQ